MCGVGGGGGVGVGVGGLDAGVCLKVHLPMQISTCTKWKIQYQIAAVEKRNLGDRMKVGK